MTHWIFQGNPDKFNLNEKLQGIQIIDWTVTFPKHQKMVSAGDVVFIWRAQGSSKHTPGIVAVGKIVGPVIPESFIPESYVQHSDYLWFDRSIKPYIVKTFIELHDIRLTKSEGMLSLNDIKADPLLSKMRIVKIKTGSNFILTENEYERLMQLWEMALMTTKVEYDKKLEKQIEESLKLSKDERQKRGSQYPKIPLKTTVKQSVFIRNPHVIVEVLERAGGLCERCLKPAPFLRYSDKTPYLEVHHRIPLAQGGEDTVQNARALCPNCHREAHFGMENTPS